MLKNQCFAILQTLSAISKGRLGVKNRLQKIVAAINTHLVETDGPIGQYNEEFEPGGSTKAAYGKALLPTLSKDLSLKYRKGCSLSNIIIMTQLYSAYPIYAELPHKLNWTHFVELFIRYALHNVSSQLFVSKYQLYLPNREALQQLIQTELQRVEDDA